MEINNLAAAKELMAQRSGWSSGLAFSRRQYATGSSIPTFRAAEHLALVVVGANPSKQGQMFLQIGTTPTVALVSATQSSISRAQVNKPVSLKETIQFVREIFALNVQDAAEVFHVSRPTIYQWMDAIDFSVIRSKATLERVHDLCYIAMSLQSKTKLTGNWVKATLVVEDAQVSVFQLLKGESLNMTALNKALQVLGAHMVALRKETNLRAQDAIRTLIEAVPELGHGTERRRR